MHRYDRAPTTATGIEDEAINSSSSLTQQIQQQSGGHPVPVFCRTSPTLATVTTAAAGGESNNLVFKADKDKVRALSFTSDISIAPSTTSNSNSASPPLLYSSSPTRSWSRSWSWSSSSSSSASCSSQYDEETGFFGWADRERRSRSGGRRRGKKRSVHHQVTPDHVKVLRLVWFLTLVFGEYAVFWIMLRRCRWPEKLSWDQNATAIQERYRIVIIADPQLTERYSYKETGLSLRLTEFFTDMFMRKSYTQLHRRLQPDMVVFLGNLLDGGRETMMEEQLSEKDKDRFIERVFDSGRTAWNWEPLVMDEENMREGEGFGGVATSQEKVESRIRNITGHYQQVTYPAFGSVERAQIRRDGKSARLYVAGNHDMRFGDTLARQAMRRYKKDFGSVNYEIKVGNHSLVVLDTLALSSNITSISEESREFLDRMEHEQSTGPRILLTHIPLFRPETTPCGEAREGKQLILDRSRKQHQNMISPSISQEILRKIQPDMIFSGDDHDWCEMAHSLDGRLVPEVTVPTFRFAQGITQSGFVVLSLHNPQEQQQEQIQQRQRVSRNSAMQALRDGYAKFSDHATFAYDECILPKQMAIVSGYSCLLVFTFLWLVAHRVKWLKQRRHGVSNSGLYNLNSNRFSSSPHPLQNDTATAMQGELFSFQETTEKLRHPPCHKADSSFSYSSPSSSSSSNDDEKQSVDSLNPSFSSLFPFSSSNAITTSLPSPLFSSSPLSPLPRPLLPLPSMNNMKRPQRRRHWLRLRWRHMRLFWAMVAWDFWDIVCYVIPFYLLELLASALL
ncbi:MAG: Metallo-dependent phosphatase-like protein [Linnemannia gamsii]|nr:MAG: Metallo-dependent phosphatase-like protein [Linnemannia gamsii]